MAWVTILANFVAVAVSFVLIRPLIKLTRVRGTYLVPALLMLLTVGAYTASNNFADVIVMLAASAFGVVCVRWNWPRVPFLLAVVLGSIAERYLFLSYELYRFEWLTRPFVLIVALIMVLTVSRSVLRSSKRKKDSSEPDTRRRMGVSS
jgi:putative tricarboxylic transport membrane protein